MGDILDDRGRQKLGEQVTWAAGSSKRALTAGQQSTIQVCVGDMVMGQMVGCESIGEGSKMSIAGRRLA